MKYFIKKNINKFTHLCSLYFHKVIHVCCVVVTSLKNAKHGEVL